VTAIGIGEGNDATENDLVGDAVFVAFELNLKGRLVRNIHVRLPPAVVTRRLLLSALTRIIPSN
jgi:hypothetical protein